MSRNPEFSNDFDAVPPEEVMERLMPPQQETLRAIYDYARGLAREWYHDEAEFRGGDTLSRGHSVTTLEVRTHLRPQRDLRHMARVLSLAAEEVTARGQITRQQYELWYENGEDHFELQDVHRQRRDGARDGQPSCSEYGARRLLELVMPPEAAAA